VLSHSFGWSSTTYTRLVSNSRLLRCIYHYSLVSNDATIRNYVQFPSCRSFHCALLGTWLGRHSSLINRVSIQTEGLSTSSRIHFKRAIFSNFDFGEPFFKPLSALQATIVLVSVAGESASRE